MAISINKVDEAVRQQIVQDYKTGKSMRQIEQDYKVTRSTVSKYLTNLGIKTVAGNHHRLYNHNEFYFHDIQAEHPAYWLGFMFADGYIINNEERYGQDQFGLSLALEDKEMINLFKQDLEATNPIHEYERNTHTKGQPLCRIQLTSQQTVDDLIFYGCTKQKSRTLQPPKNLPEKVIHHFIRGFFDGDGSITKVKNERYKITDGYAYGINITTTYAMAEWLQYFFEMGSIVKDNRRETTYYYSLGGHRQVIKFYHILYDTATIYMPRKFLRFQELLNKYDESQGSNV